MISQERADQIAKEGMDAWNSRDLDRIMHHHAEAVEFVAASP